MSQYLNRFFLPNIFINSVVNLAPVFQQIYSSGVLSNQCFCTSFLMLLTQCLFSNRHIHQVLLTQCFCTTFLKFKCLSYCVIPFFRAVSKISMKFHKVKVEVKAIISLEFGPYKPISDRSTGVQNWTTLPKLQIYFHFIVQFIL